MKNKKFYTRTETAEILGVSPQTVSNYETKGLLHGDRSCGRVARYAHSEVYALRKFPEFHDIQSMQDAVVKMQAEMQEMHAQLSERYTKMREEFRIAFTNGHPNNWYRYRELVMKILTIACGRTLTERDTAILMDVLDFDTLQEAADRHGLTRERVRQVFERSLRRIVKFRDIATRELETANDTIAMLKKKVDDLNATVWALEHPEFGKPATEFVTELEKYRETSPFNIKIAEFGVSVRAFNCCRAADIYTIGDLVAHTRLQMIKMRNFGRKSLNELELLLDKLGLDWGMWTDPDYDYAYMRRKTDA